MTILVALLSASLAAGYATGACMEEHDDVSLVQLKTNIRKGDWRATPVEGGDQKEDETDEKGELVADTSGPRKIPDWLRDLGLSIYGSPERLQDAVRNSQFFRHTINGMELNVHCGPKDDISDQPQDITDSFKTYGADRLTSMPADTIVYDIGANVGVLTAAYWKTNPKLSLIALEGMPETFFYLVWNLHDNGVPILKGKHELNKPGVLPLNVAVGKDNHTSLIGYPKILGEGQGENIAGHGQSSMHVQEFNHFEEFMSTDALAFNMTTVELKTLSKKLGVSGRKLGAFFDCQGCEFDGIQSSLENMIFMGGELHCSSDQRKDCDLIKESICNRGQQQFFSVFDQPPECLYRKGVHCPGEEPVLCG